MCEDLLFGRSRSSRVDFQDGKIKKCGAPFASSCRTSPQTEGPLSPELNICRAVGVYLLSAGLWCVTFCIYIHGSAPSRRNSGRGVSAGIITAAHGKERRTGSPSLVGLPVSDYRQQRVAADWQSQEKWRVLDFNLEIVYKDSSQRLTVVAKCSDGLEIEI